MCVVVNVQHPLRSTACLVYWGLSLFPVKMSNDRFMSYFLSGLIEVPAGVIGPLLLGWYELCNLSASFMCSFRRKSISVVSYVLTGIPLIVLVFVPKTGKWGHAVLNVNAVEQSRMNCTHWCCRWWVSSAS
jgi:hypothetical protein